MSRKSSFQSLSIIGFVLVLIATWWSLATINTDFWLNNVSFLFFMGIVGLVLFGLSLAIMYKSDHSSKHPRWRLLEKVGLVLGFIFILWAWFFSGFTGTTESFTNPISWASSIVGFYLMIIGSVSFTARTTNFEKLYAPTRAAKAGSIITIISLVIPWTMAFGSGGFQLDWQFFGGDFASFGNYFFNLTQFALMDMILSVIILIALLVGATLLLAVPSLPKLGASTVLAGVVISIGYFFYNESMAFSNAFVIVPVGMFLAVAGAVIGMVAKGSVSKPPLREEPSSLDRLVRLKALLDSGAITKEEFEQQKKIILEANEKN